MRNSLALIGLVLSIARAAAPAAGDGPLQRLEASEEAMGASFSLVLLGPDVESLERAAGAVFAEVHRLDAMLSNYKASSEWSELNRSAAQRPVAVSRELFALLLECQRYSELSEGAFDITVGPLVRVWGFYRGEGALPQEVEVRKALDLVGYRKVVLDSAHQTVTFTVPGVELDPGGIGKGYAVDRMVDILRSHGVPAALVSAAGSSIYGLGAPPENPGGWRVAIREPRNPEAAAAEVLLRDMSISTSGGYEKFFWADGRSYSHIMDPRTGYPAPGTGSVSVLAARTVDSEAWTKPAFIQGPEWTAARKPDGLRVFYCADAPQPACRWID